MTPVDSQEPLHREQTAWQKWGHTDLLPIKGKAPAENTVSFRGRYQVNGKQHRRRGDTMLSALLADPPAL